MHKTPAPELCPKCRARPAKRIYAGRPCLWVLRYTDLDAQVSESRGEDPLPPMLILFPWAAVDYVSVQQEDLETS